MKYLNKLTVLLCLTLLVSCTNKSELNISGIGNLEKKSNSIILNTSNKNDILKDFGKSIFTEKTIIEKWLYFETIYTKTLFGNKKIIKNDVLIIFFDKRGIVLKKEFLTLKELNQEIKFDSTKTEVYALNQSILNKFSSTVKKRIENKNKQQQ